MESVLITGAAGPAGSALARQARALGVRVVGVDMAPIADATLCDETHLVPRADDPSFLPVLRRLIRATEVDALIPTVQEELPIVAGAADHLGVTVIIGSLAAVATAQDKLTTAWTLAAAGVPVPRFCAAEDVATEAEPAWLGALPAGERVVLKPRVSRGGRGVEVLDARSELRGVAPHRPGGIVQEFAPGAEYCPQVYVSPVTGAVDVVVLEKTALKEGIVGNAAGVRPVDADSIVAREVAQVARDAVRAMGLTGPVDLDVRRLADGTPVVLEINARFGANSETAPAILAGVLTDLHRGLTMWRAA